MDALRTRTAPAAPATPAVPKAPGAPAAPAVPAAPAASAATAVPAAPAAPEEARKAALQAIRTAREAKGVTFETLASAIGTKDSTYIAAALYGQHRLTSEKVKTLAAVVGVDVETAMVTTWMPAARGVPAHDRPLQVPASRADRRVRRCAARAGERAVGRRHPLGDRLQGDAREAGRAGVITIDAKFLHYKEY